ncbi:Protoporphyrinogen IX dehydrogenase [menaquinone] [Rubripirellula lacrimiformis]|uniref:Protoporphyrinogen IX dehydrogenase [menaquinone] n=1 Tax=Rubripirellula lacrimiformis TaxID=1930273 RepID=A0A517N4R3_9BACT|nr:flavodoxin domain-containing protein [Rubripirellula lacrimiformis]QDT02123.1 Protoporphyrinogen IX dehydrogenase [menaquinone] [Rubripirellula lacrimiformis]
MRAIIIYATCEGQTERIAHRIAKTLTQHGVPTDTFDVARNDVYPLAVESYDAVVLGSSLHFAEHDPRIAWCIGENRQRLTEIPTAFFSVSLGIVSEHYKDRAEVQMLADQFLQEAEFEPSLRACFAGSLRYSKYGWFKKRLMHWIADKSGRQTEMDRDYEFTNWDAVDTFAADFATIVHNTRQTNPPVTNSPNAMMGNTDAGNDQSAAQRHPSMTTQ